MSKEGSKWSWLSQTPWCHLQIVVGSPCEPLLGTKHESFEEGMPFGAQSAVDFISYVHIKLKKYQENT